MAELYDVMTKPVISKSDGKIFGAVNNVYFDEYIKRIEYFSVSRNGAEADKNMMISFADVIAFGDALMIENDLSAKYPDDIDASSLVCDIFGKEVYSANGLFRGKIEKLEFAKSSKVVKFFTETCEFLPSAFAKIGDVAILKGDASAKKKSARIPLPKTDYPVYLLNDTAPNISVQTAYTQKPDTPESFAAGQTPPQAIAVSADEREPVFSKGAFEKVIGNDTPVYQEDDGHTPTRIICDYDFLLGRVLGADLNTYSGELIARKGTAVDVNVVEKARRNGKLVELTLNSTYKTNE